MRECRVIVAGGRDFKNQELLEDVLLHFLSNKTPHDTEIVSGCARGADRLGEIWAKKIGFHIQKFPAEWDKFGKYAGPIRNKQMAEYGTHLIAFWDGISTGTADMIKVANEFKLIIKVIEYDKQTGEFRSLNSKPIAECRRFPTPD